MADLTQYNVQIKLTESGAESTAQSINKVSGSLQKLKTTVKAIGIGSALKSIFGKIQKCTLATADYIETMDYFTVSMGKASEKAQEFITRAEDLLGLDPKNLMDSLSGFENMAEGFGIAGDKAYLMSKNLTQLSADFSSMTNMSFEAAQSKMLSAFSGQEKSLRKYGVALNQASLQETAYSLGINQRVQDMTQAQKAELRYYQIMTSLSKAQGNLGQTLSSPANALRLMKSEFNKLAREIGKVFIPIMMKIIPVVIAVTEILLEGVKAIAGLFNIKVEDFAGFDTNAIGDTLEDMSTGIEDVGTAADNTAGKLNKMLMPFDELNNITSSSGTGGAGGIGGIGGSLGIDLPEYDMFQDVSKQIREEVDRIKAKLKEIIPIILIVVGALLGLFVIWKIVKFITGLKKGTDGLGKSTVSLKKGINKLFESIGKALEIIAILGGLALVLESVTHLIEAFGESGLTVKDVLILLGGILLEVVAAFAILALIMEKFDPSLKSIAGSGVIFIGLTAILLSLSQVIEALGDSEMETTDLLLQLGGVMAEIALLGLVLVGLGELLQSPLAMAGVLVITLAIVAVLFTLANTLADILDPIAIFIDDTAPTVIAVIEAIGAVIDTIIEKIGEILPPIIEALGETFEKIFNGISTVVETVGGVVSNIVETMGESINTVLGGIKEVIRQIGETIETVAHTIIWFIDNLGPSIENFSDSLIRTTTKIVNFVISAIEYLVNRVVDGANSLATVANKIPGVSIGKSSPIKIPRFYPTYAEGGFPETGQLFIANEAGPELIGNIGNRTAVANKDQITTAIANATYQAMTRALAENNQNDGQPIIVNVGNEQLYKGMTNYRNQQSNMYGINI